MLGIHSRIKKFCIHVSKPLLFGISILLAVSSVSVFADTPSAFSVCEGPTLRGPFWPSEMVTMRFTEPDGTPLNGDAGLSWEMPAPSIGDFKSFWEFNWEYAGRELLITANGNESGASASLTFWAPNESLNQLQNGEASSVPNWANETINNSNSCYSEGRVIPYRWFANNMIAGSSHYFTIGLDWSRNNVHIIDYITDYDISESAGIASAGGVCGTNSTIPPPGCSLPTTSFTFPDFLNTGNYSGPIPSNFFTTVNPGFVIHNPGSLQAYNVTIDSIGKYTFAGPIQNRILEVEVYFTTNTSGSVGFYWGGHLAQSTNDSWGYNNGSASIGEAFYRMRAGAFDGNCGSKKGVVQNNSLCIPPYTEIVSDSAMVCNAGGYVYDARNHSDLSSWNSDYVKTWSIINGTIVGPDDQDTVFFTVNPGLMSGDSVVLITETCDTLSGCLGDYCCSSDTLVLPTMSCNQPPVASCPSNESHSFLCPPASQICVSGFSYSDPDNNVTSESVDFGTLSGGSVCFTPDTAGVYTITYTVVDSYGLQDQCQTQVTVSYTNVAPVCNLPANGSYFVCDDTTFSFPVSATDADGNLTGCTKTSGSGSFNGSDWTFTTTAAGVYSATFECTDDCGATCTGTVSITVGYNTAPVASCPSNESYSFNCDPAEICISGFSATDADNNISGKSVDFGTLSGGSVCFTPDTAGVYTITYTATDICGAEDECQTQVTVSYDNVAPVCNLPGDGSYFVCGDTTFSFPVSATDADGNLTGCTMTSGSGSFDGSNWTFTTTAAGVYSATFECTDDCGATCGGTVNITVGYNTAPVCDLPADASYFACGDTTFSFPVSATDVDGNLTGCTMTSGPGSFDGSDWTFTTTAAGVYSATFECTDDCGATCGGTVNITVGYNTAPVCDLPDDASYFACGDTTFSFPVSATDADGNLTGCTMTSGPGSFDGSDWTFTTTAAGVYSATFECTDDCGATCTGTVNITVGYNTAPVASCPSNESHSFNCDPTEICVSGFSATDADNNITGESVDFGTLSGGSVCFTPDTAGVYTITYTATDICGAEDECQTQVTVSYDNVAPVCDLPDDASYFACGDTAFSFPVSATDADGNLTGCTMTSGPGSFDGSDWTFTTTAAGVYSATFECTDDCGATCGGTVNITVGYNTAPVCDLPDDASYFACGDSTFSFPVSATDADGNLTGCTMTSGPGSFDGSDWTFTTTAAGVYSATFECTDDCGATCTGTVNITVGYNTAPVASCPSNESHSFNCDPTEICVSGFSATDADNNITGESVDFGTLSGGSVCFTPDTAGVYTITYTATDICGAEDECQTQVTVSYDNVAPVCDIPADGSYFACGDTTFSFPVSATDADGNLSGCTMTSGSGSFDGSNWTFTTTAAGVYSATFECTDDCGATCGGTVNITVGYNTAPVCDLPDDASYFACGDTTFSFPVSATDADGNLTGCTMTSGPGSFDGSDWTFTTTAAGVYSATFECTDDCGATCTGTVNITVGYNVAPVASCPSNESHSFNCDPAEICVSGFSATDADNNLTGESVDFGTLSGGSVCFTPDTAGVYTITYTATDICGAEDECQTQVTVSYDNTAPVCDIPDDASYFACGDTTFSFPVSATDVDGNLTGCTMTSGSGNFDGSDWTFTTTAAGVYSATFECTDDCGATCGGTVNITVGYNTAPVCDLPDDASYFACGDTTFAFPVSATDADGNLTGCTMTSGSGSFDGSNWTFTTTAAGVYSATFECTDACGATCTGTVNITVGYNTAPVCDIPDDASYFVCGDSTFSFPVSATDADGNLTGCTMTSGPGSFDGSDWTFTTTAAGVYSATFECTDDCGATCGSTVNITVGYNTDPVASCPSNESHSFSCDPAEICVSGFSATDTDNNLTGESVDFGTLSGGSVCFTPDTAGVYTITYTATDICGAEDECQTQVTVSYDNVAPVASCPANESHSFSCDPAEICVSGFSATDTDNNLTGESVDFGTLSGGSVCFTPDTAGVYTITYTATDVCGAEDECQTQVTVSYDNVAPVCDIPDDASYFACGDTTFSFPVSATDADGNLTGCTMTSGSGSFDGSNWTFTTTAAGVYSATFECTDDCGATCTGTVNITVGYNTAPVCDLPDDTSYFACGDTTFSFPVSATDADGNLSGCTMTSGSGSFDGSNWTFTTTAAGVYSATFECTDDCGLTCTGTVNITVGYNTVPVATVNTQSSLSVCDLSPITISGFSCSDPDDNLDRCEVDNGTLSGDSVTFTPVEGENIITLFAIDLCGLVDSAKGIINVTVNQNPSCQVPADQSIFLCNPSEVCIPIPAIGSDNSVTCEIVSGPGTIVNGEWCYTPSGNEIANVTIRCTDECGAYCEDSFAITFDINNPPTVTCLEDTSIYIHNLEEICISGFVCEDVNGNLSSCEISGVSGSLTGETVCFDPVWGDNVIELTATDSCGATSTCTTTVAVVEITDCPIVQIEKTHGTLQGHYVTVSVTIENGQIDMAGFDFLLAYDASALTFVGADAGALLTYCGWEHFTFRFGSDGNCGDACPSGLLRIIGLAETNNGSIHPQCFGAPTSDPWELAVLTFFVNNDRTLNSMYAPITFFWDDCADNAISNISGDSMIIDSRIYSFENTLIWDEDDDVLFPESERIRFVGTTDSCAEGTPKGRPIRCIDFVYGGVDIVPSDSIDDRGDINMNGLENEIADAVMFSNYFLYGLSVFGDHVEGSIAASDVNADGLSLSLADLVYLIRVINGDASPLHKIRPGSELIINPRVNNGNMTVEYESNSSIGAALLIFETDGSIGTPVLGDGAENMDMSYNLSGNQLRVLVYNIGSNYIKPGQKTLVSIPSNGSISLIEVDAADYSGGVITTTIQKMVSDNFELSQNYPNPFNPTTTIGLTLTAQSDWTIEIFNIAGQRIREYSGNTEAGVVSIVWDGTDDNGNTVASGIYLYRAAAGGFKATRKMILMK